ncbi:hypothetical protein JTE90_017969 [Oedothorax gibbosus]|uniref:Uncharacterized protein n=1 Tax=Oedothorax gibbosus TaxID=931172 RepID=A0AAV6V772_9ARAC|nr:hypothetical protein JTE90_017969 [Oedothorax gibbosus]
MPVISLDMADLANSNPALAQKKARICVGLGMAQARDFEMDMAPSEEVQRANTGPKLAYLTPRRQVPRHGPVGIDAPDGHAGALRVSNPDDMSLDIGNFNNNRDRGDKQEKDKRR